MKKLFTLIAIFICFVAHAQNYQCLQSGVKHYFTNADGYLRGIRIDSVRTSGSDTIYYPYHTQRTPGYLSTIIPPIGDTAGSSWLGKNVIERPDGIFIFNNMWDTVFIKSHAHLGDSWMFFNDTTQLYYIATVSFVDTMSILGYVDSIKTISITAYKSGVVDSIDPVNNFQIILSKNNGFIQVFDLYNFPYHEPDSNSYDFLAGHISTRFDDFYLDELLGDLGSCDLGCYPFDKLADTTNSIFHLISIHDPTMMEVYDFAPGDVYESYNSGPSLGTSYYPYGVIILDSIISKTVTTYNVSYTVQEHRKNLAPVYDSYGHMIGDTATYVSYTVVWNFDTTTLLNLNNKMPEEYGVGYIMHYFPFDTSLCNNPAKYQLDQNYQNIRYLYNGTADLPTYFTQDYSMGYGFTSLNAVDHPDLSPEFDEIRKYIYIYKNGSPCLGEFTPATAGINSISLRNDLQIFPNPANNELTIKTSSTLTYTITIHNIIGREVYSLHTTLQQQTINTTELPEGLYNVTITDESGYRYNNKIVITH